MAGTTSRQRPVAWLMMDWFCRAGETHAALTASVPSVNEPSLVWMLQFPHLRKMPRHLLHVGHPVTVDELGDAADLIVDDAAGVFPRASQRTQEELSIFGVTPQLWENKRSHILLKLPRE